MNSAGEVVVSTSMCRVKAEDELQSLRNVSYHSDVATSQGMKSNRDQKYAMRAARMVGDPDWKTAHKLKK